MLARGRRGGQTPAAALGALFSVALGTLLATSPVLASECKGLEQEACQANEACTWVDSYERKDGRVVRGYCRLRGGRQPAAAES
ncbi:MAG: hypothetical protein EA400_09855 [Chromatiaceae bacterium]|nr:MAG: hypothetical protein EA400_09855 [Chromatiaceae bacterium]